MSQETIDAAIFQEEESVIYDTGNERAILGVLMKDSTQIINVEPHIKTDAFFNAHNRYIYEVMLHMYSNAIKSGVVANFDPMSIMSIAESHGKKESFLRKSGGYDHLDSIRECPADAKSLSQYIDRAKQIKARVETHRKGRDLQKMALNPGVTRVSEFMSSVENATLSFTGSSHDSEIKKIGEDVEGYLQEKIAIKKAGKTPGVPITCMPKLNHILQTLRRKQLIVLFSRAKVGKSAFLVNVGIDVAIKQNIPVLYIDTEMSMEEQLSRILASSSAVREDDIIDGSFDNDDGVKQQVMKMAGVLRGAPFYYISARGMDVKQIVSTCRRFKSLYVGEEEINGKMRTKDCLIIYDWIKVSDKNDIRNSKEYQELGFITTAIKDIGNELDVPIIAGAQANRLGSGVGEEEAQNPDTMVGDSDRILRFCTALLHLRKPNLAEQGFINQLPIEEQYTHILQICFQRQGGVNLRGIAYNYIGEQIFFNELNNDPISLLMEKKKKREGRETFSGSATVGGNSQNRKPEVPF